MSTVLRIKKAEGLDKYTHEETERYKPKLTEKTTGMKTQKTDHQRQLIMLKSKKQPYKQRYIDTPERTEDSAQYWTESRYSTVLSIGQSPDIAQCSVLDRVQI
jgi:hypothetical protein